MTAVDEIALPVAPTTRRELITEPGVYDLPADVYHSDPVEGGSLSSTGARKLLSPSCPAKFRYWQQHEQAAKREFDLGHAAHAEVLGVGASLVVVDAKDWRTKAAQAERDAAYAAGKTPILAKEYLQVQAMVAVLRADPIASRLFSREYMTPEQTLVWRDEETGIWCRAMLDGLPLPGDRRMIIPDYKTTTCAEPGHIKKAIADYGYHCQASWYRDGVIAVGLDPDPAFVLIFQEKTPPYLITPVWPDDEALAIGRDRNRKARHEYARCSATDTWPGYTTDVLPVSLPPWVITQHEAAWLRGDYDFTEERT